MSAVDEFLNKKSEDAQKWQDVVSGMLNNVEAYGYAEQTLMGIYDFIEENRTVTEAQIEAIKNIRLKPHKLYGY